MAAGGTRPIQFAREKLQPRTTGPAEILTAFTLFIMPFFVFTSTVYVLAFFSYTKPWAFWAGILFAVSIPVKYALSAWTADPDDEKEYKQQRSDVFYTWVTGAALVCGLIVGYLVYTEVFFQYYATSMGETYNNVVPTVGADQHADATVINFEAQARVNTYQSGGFRRHRCDPLGPSFMDFLCWGSNLYCVAPVMGGVQQSEVQYWSIGEDCCTDEGSFACGAVVEADTTAGKNCLVEVSPSPWIMAAVNMTVAKYGLASSPDAIFCRFVQNVQADLDGQRSEGNMILTGSTVVAAAVSAFIAYTFYPQLV